MKYPALLALALTPAVLAAPAVDENQLDERTYTPWNQIERLVFGVSLPQFQYQRARRSPPSVDWSSDGCNGGPNNPFGYPFTPACQRHDFAYQNFKAHDRLTKLSRKRIDEQFRRDMYHQCESVQARKPCYRLADVYYRFGRWFGGRKRADADAETPEGEPSYEEALAAYQEAVTEAQAEGALPAAAKQD
ncbi:hypothetical protein E4U42_005715 [Claviceps africana]|uniref:Secretory phospholipase A2 n=1 Tax=Claviceps africana TaxID=83212 RepID=A0A8K0NFD3_9HYPO|nr:hypothetical protein E4U42_005715 [Claviceps africana]